MIKGDKIKLAHEMGVFTNIGEICEVTDIKEDGTICFKFGGGKHLGCMSYDEYKKYFEPVMEEKQESKKKWTNWYRKNSYRLSILHGVRYPIPIYYRDNGKKVQVKCYAFDKTYRSESTCHRDDKFILNRGLGLAIKRLQLKLLEAEVENYAKSL